jgi:nicotinate-nucleotide adenylyltransferase
MKVGLFFGSFNPVHNGHMIIANYMLEYSDIEQIWFVLSPQNPFKKKKNLLEDYHRLAMLEEAVGDLYNYRVSDIELKMPKPSYTIDTLTYLKERHPNNEFVLLMGADNLKHFHKWKNADQILENYALKVYARPGEDKSDLPVNPKIRFYDAPQMEISSSFIRRGIKEKKDLRFFMPAAAYQYMREMHFYE